MDASPGRDDGWRALVIFVLSGLAGGVLAAVVGATSLPGSRALLDATPFPFFMGAAAVAGGVMAGWFVATLALARSQGGVHCPRCGTVNPPDAGACRACDLRTA